jgi:hypothetical protein
MGVIASLMMFALWPPARGELLLVPLMGTASADMIPLALTNGALLVARGPIPGSFVVYGDRQRLTGPLWNSRTLILAAPKIACGRA